MALNAMPAGQDTVGMCTAFHLQLDNLLSGKKAAAAAAAAQAGVTFMTIVQCIHAYAVEPERM